MYVKHKTKKEQTVGFQSRRCLGFENTASLERHIFSVEPIVQKLSLWQHLQDLLRTFPKSL